MRAIRIPRRFVYIFSKQRVDTGEALARIAKLQHPHRSDRMREIRWNGIRLVVTMLHYSPMCNDCFISTQWCTTVPRVLIFATSCIVKVLTNLCHDPRAKDKTVLTSFGNKWYESLRILIVITILCLHCTLKFHSSLFILFTIDTKGGTMRE